MTEDKRKIDKIYNSIDKLAKKGKDQVFEYYKFIDEIIRKGEYGYFEQTLAIYYDIDIIDLTVDIVKKNTWKEILFNTNSTFLTKLKTLYNKNSVYQIGFNIHTQNLNNIQITLSGPFSTTYSTLSASQSISAERIENVLYLNIGTSSIYNISTNNSVWNPTPSNISIIDDITIATQSSVRTDIPIIYDKEYLITVYDRSPYNITNYKLEFTRNSYLGRIDEIESYSSYNNNKYYLENKNFSKKMGNYTTYLNVTKYSGEIVSFTQSDMSLSEDQNLLNKYDSAISFLIS